MLIERPYTKSFSKNDIRYVWQLTDLDRPGLFLQVKILYKALADVSFSELYTFDLKPNSDGYVYLYMQGYLDSLVNYVLPTVGQVVSAADGQAVNFYVQSREIDDDHLDPDWNTAEINYVRTVIKGGIEKNKFDRNNVFSNYLDTQKVFLTWQPRNHFVHATENVFLSFINSTVGQALKLKVVCTDVQEVVQTPIIINISGDNLIYHLNVGLGALNNIIFAYCMYWDVSITNADGTVTLLNPYRFYLEYRPSYKYYDLIYFNSLSGIDNVRVMGETDVTVNRDYDETEGGMELDWSSKVKPFETSNTNIRLQRQFKGDIGYLRSKRQQEVYLEMLASGPIYQITDDKWIPIIGLQKSVDLGTTKDTKQSFPIEWSLSEANEVFTPEGILFGAGSNVFETPPLLPPTNFTETGIEDLDDSNATFTELTETGRTVGSSWVQKAQIGGTPVAGDTFHVTIHSVTYSSTYSSSIAAVIADLVSQINAANIAVDSGNQPPSTITAAVDISNSAIIDITFDYVHSAAISCGRISTTARISLSFTAPDPAPDSYTIRVTNTDTSVTTVIPNFTGTVNVTRGHNYTFELRAEYTGGSSDWTDPVTLNVP